MGDEDLGIGGGAFVIFLEVEVVGLAGVGQSGGLVLQGDGAGTGVILENGRGHLAEDERDALDFGGGAFASGSGGGDVALIAIEDGKIHGEFGERFGADGLRLAGIELFEVIGVTGADEQVGDGGAAGARDGGVCASDAELGDFHRGAIAQNRLQDFGGVQVGQIGEIAGEGREGKFGLADDGSEYAPGAQLFLLLGEDGERGLIGFDLGLEDVGLVSLADIEKLARGCDGVLGEGAEFGARFDHFLRGERLVERDADAVGDAQALFGGFGLGLIAFGGENFAGEGEFAAENYVLLDVDALLAAAEGASANFFAEVADGGIGEQAGLKRASGGGADAGLGLGESGIIGESDLKELVESEGGRGS